MSTTTPGVPKPKQADQKIAARWGAELAAAGWTAIPNVIFQRQNAFGLDALDINILMHLASYWWTPGNDAHPAKGTLAKAIGVNARTIQRRIAAMEAGGLIKRIERTLPLGGTTSNSYSFEPLIEKAKPFALEAIQEKEQRQKEAIARSTRKKPKVLTLVPGGKDNAA